MVLGDVGDALFGGSSNESTTQQPAFARRLGKGLAGGFGDLFGSTQGLATGLSQPMGVIGSQFQNLFGEDSSKDFLGARSALERNLSGAGFGDAFQSAFEQMLPSTQRAIDVLGQGVLNQASPQGLRFSTDVADITSQGAQDILNQALSRSAQVGTNLFNTQTQAALNVFDLIGSLGEGQMQRQVPLAVSLATGTPPISRSVGESTKGLPGLISSLGGAKGVTSLFT